jgi:hypothetical protein
MKKIKLFLMAAVVLASASAFSTRSVDDPLYVKDKGNWVLRTMADGNCISQLSSHCEFTRKAVFHTPYQDVDFIPADQDRIWVPAP